MVLLLLLLLLLLLVVLLAMLLAISGPGKAGGISRRLINMLVFVEGKIRTRFLLYLLLTHLR